MKRLSVLLLVLTLLLTGCAPIVMTDGSEGDLGITAAAAMEELRVLAADLSVNIFDGEPQLLDVDDGAGYAYKIADGVRFAMYANKQDLLTSVYVSVTNEECTEGSEEKLEEYTDLLISYFTPPEELESVLEQLHGYSSTENVLESSAGCSTCIISITGDNTVTYFSIVPYVSEE